MHKTVLLLLVFVLGISKTFAAAYWLDVDGPGKLNKPVTIKLYYGSMNDRGVRQPDTGKELQLTGDFKLSIIDADGVKTDLTLTLTANCWQASYTPHKKGTYRIIGVNDKHPVVDRSASGGENVLPVDYVCAIYMVETTVNANFTPLQTLDIVTGQRGDAILVKAFNQNKPAAKGEKLRVFNPENWEKELTLDEHGEAVFYPTMKGLYIIRQDWFEPKAGELKGVPFKRIRHRCNYYLMVR